MPRGNGFNWHTESLRNDLSELLLQMNVGDCFTSKTLAKLLHQSKNHHRRNKGTKRLNTPRKIDIASYMEARHFFARLALGIAERSSEINFITRYMRKGCKERIDTLGSVIYESRYYEIVQ